MKLAVISVLLALAAGGPAAACELCAIYNASDAHGEFSSGLLFTLEEQFIRFGTPQLAGQEVKLPYANYLDTSITHLVPSYNISPRLGISLNMPVIYNAFERTDLRYSAAGSPPLLGVKLLTEKGHEAGIGDMALVGRWTAVDKTTMHYGIVLNLLGGVKFPTGDSSYLKDEIEQDRIYQNYFVPPGTPHDPLSHAISPVHLHDLALGSGSTDGILGATLNTRWGRWFFNTQLQYYLRTEGEDSFQYGNELILSTGPGGYILLGKNYTLSLRANATYETMAEDTLLGQKSALSGETAWYLGPQLIFTWGSRFSANAGVDLPLRVANQGLQNAADYRITAGLSWRF